MSYKVFLILVLIMCIGCAKPVPRKPVVQKTSTFLNESIERNRVMNEAEEQAFLDLMKKDTTINYIPSENGFWYYYNSQDTLNTRLPVKGDEVVYSYEIRDIKNNLLYSKDELGLRNYLVDKQELISGLQDGLKLMKQGEEITFFFPSHKAYGYSGYKKIGSNQPLIYKVQLQQIIPQK